MIPMVWGATPMTAGHKEMVKGSRTLIICASLLSGQPAENGNVGLPCRSAFEGKAVRTDRNFTIEKLADVFLRAVFVAKLNQHLITTFLSRLLRTRVKLRVPPTPPLMARALSGSTLLRLGSRIELLLLLTQILLIVDLIHLLKVCNCWDTDRLYLALCGASGRGLDPPRIL